MRFMIREFFGIVIGALIGILMVKLALWTISGILMIIQILH